MALAGIAAATVGCNETPTAPTPDFVGNYAFVVEASPVCQLPVSRYDWNLVATAAGAENAGGEGGMFRMTLPGGDPTLNLTLGYQTQGGGGRGGQARTVFNIVMNVQSVPFGENLFVTINGGARGTGAFTAGGRGAVPDGAINGTIRLSESNPSGGRRDVGNCTAGDHRFTLTPQ
jgi:hypothetical protein